MFAGTSMIPQTAIPTTASLPAQHSKTSPQTGLAPYAASAKTNSVPPNKVLYHHRPNRLSKKNPPRSFRGGFFLIPSFFFPSLFTEITTVVAIERGVIEIENMTMYKAQYFHLCADGHQAQNFILSTRDFVAAMNIVALCAANTAVSVVAFALEDTHPHFLLYGTSDECVNFKLLFETTYKHYAASTREEGARFRLEIELYPVDNSESALRNVAAYIVSQPTKDGKDIMPFDYRWSSGSLYFRRGYHLPIWLFDDAGNILKTETFGELSVDRKREVTHSRRYLLPDNWIIVGNLVLPSNFVNIERFESIYRTPNCYRVFLAGSRKQDEGILNKISQIRGVLLEDTEARAVCGDECKMRFGTRDPRRLDSQDRVLLAQILRRQHNMTLRQIATVVRLPESEVRRYVP